MNPTHSRILSTLAVLGLCLLGAATASAVEVTFEFAAPGAGGVYLAGEFNNWSDSANPMVGADGVWTLTLDLAPGRYMYKFVVDGAWTEDPTNPDAADDGFGGKNSILEVGEDGAAVAPEATTTAAEPAATPAATPEAPAGTVNVTFSYTGTGSSVFVAGEFNNWSPNGDAMTDADGDGVFEATLALKPGQYAYKFVVDGNWMQDPNNPAGVEDGFGGQNSLVDVKTGAGEMGATEGATATPLAPAGDAQGLRSVEFKFTPVISGVGAIFLAGTFNDWNDSKTPMTDADNDGTYTATMLLAPGSYQYKFVVDGNWKADPNNPNGVDDGYGGQNSVLDVDASFAAIEIELGDDKVYADDLEPIFDYSTCNPLTETLIALTARAHFDDVESVTALYKVDGGALFEKELDMAEADPAFQYYRGTIELPDADSTLEYVIRYRDGEGRAYLGATGVTTDGPGEFFRYTAADHPPFLTPEWAKDGVIYQIFPERFANGDTSNDPDFSEPWYEGVHELPASGRTNGEYFHMVDDWYDVGGLLKSPYRTDGRPDYYSFYGGDIAGIRQKLDYLNDLGITVIYFNPLNQGMSNHKYDPVDYLKIDPHFGTEQEMIDFVADCHDHGIRVVVDMAFNHTGNWHFAFRDAVEKGPDSEYYNWYEFKRWPLPAGRDVPNASDYYDCWWGFGLHPNLNFDLGRANADENNIDDPSQVQVNQPVVDYVLSVADKWLGDYDIDGFRLDVPNEVPFWFWEMFNDRCKSIKADCWLVGELWGNAGRWIGPHCFDATMNYKFFRDPVMDFFGKGTIDASAFDQRLAPGRFQYPPQSVAVMMNLIDSHDTVRFLTTSRDIKRQMLAVLFGMTYVGMPTIWYGDEVGMLGDKDPDCRRPFDWRYEGDTRKAALRDFYGTVTRFRRDNKVLSRGNFSTLVTDGKVYGFARTLDGTVAVTLFNAGNAATTVTLDTAMLRELGAGDSLKVVVGPDSFPQTGGGNVSGGGTVDLGGETIEITLPGMTGALLVD